MCDDWIDKRTDRITTPQATLALLRHTVNTNLMSPNDFSGMPDAVSMSFGRLLHHNTRVMPVPLFHMQEFVFLYKCTLFL